MNSGSARIRRAIACACALACMALMSGPAPLSADTTGPVPAVTSPAPKVPPPPVWQTPAASSPKAPAAPAAPASPAAPAVTGAQPTGSAQPMPMAVYPEARHEFSAVMEGVEIKHDFVIENRGKAPLTIKSVRPD